MCAVRLLDLIVKRHSLRVVIFLIAVKETITKLMCGEFISPMKKILQYVHCMLLMEKCRKLNFH